MLPKVIFWQQQQMMDCGPIAVLNLLRWLGYSVSLRHYKQICDECGYTQRAGTKHYKISQMLKSVAGLKVTRPRRMIVKRFKNFLNGRKTAILLSFRKSYRGKGHICLVIKKYDTIKIINMCNEAMIVVPSDIEIDKLLRSHGKGFPAIWFLEKV